MITYINMYCMKGWTEKIKHAECHRGATLESTNECHINYICMLNVIEEPN
jgi:hypothetical protein